MPRHQAGTVSTIDAAREAGITYRQMWYWIAMKAVNADVREPVGRGNPYRFTRRQADHLSRSGVLYRLLERSGTGAPTTEFIGRVWDRLEEDRDVPLGPTDRWSSPCRGRRTRLARGRLMEHVTMAELAAIQRQLVPRYQMIVGDRSFGRTVSLSAVAVAAAEAGLEVVLYAPDEERPRHAGGRPRGPLVPLSRTGDVHHGTARRDPSLAAAGAPVAGRRLVELQPGRAQHRRPADR